MTLVAPPPLHLPDDLRDPSPVTQRAAISLLAAQAPWISLDWPGFLEHLLRLGRTDIPLSRLTEGHVDALRILNQAGAAPCPDSVYGVWASRSGGTGLTARHDGDAWHLSGKLVFASGAGVLDRALVTAWPDDDTHVLLDAHVEDWPFDSTDWRSRAMEYSRTHRVDLDGRVDARRIGPDSFYLDRWGFFPGGVGVAAVWAGGAARVLDLVGEATTPPKLLRLGRARTELATALALVRQTGLDLETCPEDPRLLSTLCRAGVAAAVRRILDDVRAIAGPAGLAFDEPLTRAVDDLAMYVSQQNADGDATYLGGPR